MKPRKKIPPEQELVKALKNHEEKIMDTLYQMYSPALYGIISAIVKESHIAEDLLNETFTKIWKNADRYDASKGRLFTWMLNIARNHSIDMLRLKYQRNRYRFGELYENLSLAEVSQQTTYNPDTIGLRDLVNGLPPQWSSVIICAYYNGLTHSETADYLGLPLGTVKSRIRLAIAELKTSFNDLQIN